MLPYTTTRYAVTYRIATDETPKMRDAVVNISEGYTTFESIPKILAVKHFSSNEPEAVAKVHICAVTEMP